MRFILATFFSAFFMLSTAHGQSCRDVFSNSLTPVNYYSETLHRDLLTNPDDAKRVVGSEKNQRLFENPIYRMLLSEGSDVPRDANYGRLYFVFRGETLEARKETRQRMNEYSKQFERETEADAMNVRFGSNLIALGNRFYYELYKRTLWQNRVTFLGNPTSSEPRYFSIERFAMNYYYDLSVRLPNSVLKSLYRIKPADFDFRTFHNEGLRVFSRYVGQFHYEAEPQTAWKKQDVSQDLAVQVGYRYLELSLKRLREQLQSGELSPREIVGILNYAQREVRLQDQTKFSAFATPQMNAHILQYFRNMEAVTRERLR